MLWSFFIKNFQYIFFVLFRENYLQHDSYVIVKKGVGDVAYNFFLVRHQQIIDIQDFIWNVRVIMIF